MSQSLTTSSPAFPPGSNGSPTLQHEPSNHYIGRNASRAFPWVTPGNSDMARSTWDSESVALSSVRALNTPGSQNGGGFGNDAYAQQRDRSLGEAQLQRSRGASAGSSGSIPLSPPPDNYGFNHPLLSSGYSASSAHQPFLNRHQRSNSFQHDIQSTSIQQQLPLQRSAASLGMILPSDTRTKSPTPSTSSSVTRSTLCFGDLEPWMDIEYFNQLCGLMRWENVVIKMPNATAPLQPQLESPNQAPQPNNPGYCFLTFPSSAYAASVLAQLSPPSPARFMPNSKKPFNVNWAAIPVNLPTALPRNSIDATAHVAVSGLGTKGYGAATPLSLYGPGSLAVLNSLASPSPNSAQSGVTANGSANSRQQEYSIFVGDLAPETTNSDLIAVFRDPVLGLRSDREPRFIRPFTSCKSAKIMVDPVLGISKGYGFVRFSDEADQQRALIEMQGLYCLSRPMRISQATAKVKNTAATEETPPPPQPAHQSVTASIGGTNASSADAIPSNSAEYSNTMTKGSPTSTRAPSTPTTASAAPDSGPLGNPDRRQVVSPSGAHQSPEVEIKDAALQTADYLRSLPPPTLAALSALNLAPDILAQIVQLAAVGVHQRSESEVSLNSDVGQSAASERQDGSRGGKWDPVNGQINSRSYDDTSSPGYQGAATSTPQPGPDRGQQHPHAQSPQPRPPAHATQARALLANMIGPNGGVLNSTDPYNTTVFVGGLSGLITEDTLRSFFGPFGEIHYVKIPPGKGCGFVQFVRKADAERAIERMQGFPIGGGRVRLSWGRSQSDKAAQAAAQAAQLGLNLGQLGSLQGLNASQSAQLLQTLGLASPPTLDTTVNGSGQHSDLGLPPSMQESVYYGGALRPEPVFYEQDNPGGYAVGGYMAPSSTHLANHLMTDSSILPRPYAYPTFAPFGNENAFSPTSMPASKSFAGSQSLSGLFTASHEISRPVATSQVYGTKSQNETIYPHSVDYGQNGFQGFSPYFDGSGQINDSRNRAFQASDILRSERSGSDSTIGTSSSATGATSVSGSAPLHNYQQGGSDILNLSNNLASLSFSSHPYERVGN